MKWKNELIHWLTSSYIISFDWPCLVWSAPSSLLCSLCNWSYCQSVSLLSAFVYLFVCSHFLWLFQFQFEQHDMFVPDKLPIIMLCVSMMNQVIFSLANIMMGNLSGTKISCCLISIPTQIHWKERKFQMMNKIILTKLLCNLLQINFKWFIQYIQLQHDIFTKR